MKCPYCKKDLIIKTRCILFADNYDKSILTSTQCCGNRVQVTPIDHYRVRAIPGPADTDDWGNKTKASTPADVRIPDPQYGVFRYED